MRSPYCKAKARHRRWKEEVALLCEEMRRVAQFFLWKHDEWSSLRNLRGGASDGVLEGANAYAARQANMWEALARRCVKRWQRALESVSLEIPWPLRLRSLVGIGTSRSQLPVAIVSVHTNVDPRTPTALPIEHGAGPVRVGAHVSEEERQGAREADARTGVAGARNTVEDDSDFDFDIFPREGVYAPYASDKTFLERLVGDTDLANEETDGGGDRDWDDEDGSSAAFESDGLVYDD